MFIFQSGCCKPPTKCGYTFVNATYWISPISLHVDMDCLQWSNDQNPLCYSCNACKAGLLANLKIDWLEADIFLLVALIGLIIVYIIGCCVLRNSRTEDIFRKYKQGYTWYGWEVKLQNHYVPNLVSLRFDPCSLF